MDDKYYFGLYKMNNGTFVEIYKVDGILKDRNGINIDKQELQQYIKI